jgi:hypothetical protein
MYEEISFWEQRIESLERQRALYTRQASWTSQMIKDVEQIDYYINECEIELDRLYAEVDRLEWMYD